MTIAGAFNDIAVAQGGTASSSGTIAGAIDALNDALAGSDQESCQTIEGAVRLLGEHIGGGGSSITVEALTATENKTYTAPEGKAYSPVTVNVSGGGGGKATLYFEEENLDDEDYDTLPISTIKVGGEIVTPVQITPVGNITSSCEIDAGSIIEVILPSGYLDYGGLQIHGVNQPSDYDDDNSLWTVSTDFYGDTHTATVPPATANSKLVLAWGVQQSA